VSLPCFSFAPANCLQIRWRAQTVVHCCKSPKIPKMSPLCGAHDLQRHDWLTDPTPTSIQFAIARDRAEPHCHLHAV
jgi:hypothetical protein